MKRTTYMQKIMTETYPEVAIEAIKNGFKGSWERVIAARLKKDYAAGHSEAETIVQSVGGLSDQKLLQAALSITSSEIPNTQPVK